MTRLTDSTNLGALSVRLVETRVVTRHDLMYMQGGSGVGVGSSLALSASAAPEERLAETSLDPKTPVMTWCACRVDQGVAQGLPLLHQRALRLRRDW